VSRLRCAVRSAARTISGINRNRPATSPKNDDCWNQKWPNGLPFPAHPARPDRRSMIDQYAEDSCGQHRTEHDVDRFKPVAVPHQNRANITTTIFKSWAFTGSEFSMLGYGIRS
jgi:hypothetical protein